MLECPMANPKWRESFAPRIETRREELGQRDPGDLAERAGARWDGTHLELKLLGRTYRLSHPELVVRPAGDEDPCPEELQALLLDYLASADGTSPTGKWVSFRELPQGGFYFHAFRGYAERPLVETFDNDLDALRAATHALGGAPIEFGDASFAFQVLPRVNLAVVYWAGDEEFPPNASVLFDEAASRYLPVDGLANLGRMLTSRIIKAHQAPEG